MNFQRNSTLGRRWAWDTLQVYSPAATAHHHGIMASYRASKEKVERRIGRDMFDALASYVKENPPVLWGEEQPRGFISAMVCATLYKDLFGVGYHEMISEIGSSVAIQLARPNVLLFRQSAEGRVGADGCCCDKCAWRV